jgi:hypothetical protein
VVLELQPVQLPLQWPVPLLSWCGVPVPVCVHVGSDWAVAGLPWTLPLHRLPLMLLLPLQPQLPVAALQLLAPCLAAAASRSCGQWSRPKEMAPIC